MERELTTKAKSSYALSGLGFLRGHSDCAGAGDGGGALVPSPTFLAD